jgi:peptide/nickel transport system permease protein
MKIFNHEPTKTAWIGILLVATLAGVGLFAPLISPFSPYESVAQPWASPSWEYWLGTDNVGRDMLSRIFYGARMSIAVALATTMLSFVIGIVAGFLAACGGTWIDVALSRFVDVMLSIPLLIFALIVLSVFGSSIPVLICTIAVLDSTRVFRLARAVATNIVVTEYIEVARLRGEGLWWLIRREILPNAAPPMISEFGLRFCFNFLFVAGLSFLGLGIQPPLADWGGMVRDNAPAIGFGLMAPLWPAIAIACMAVGVNLIVDYLLRISSRPSGATAEM